MPKTQPTIKRFPAIPMTVDALMKRPMANVQNYESEILRFLLPCPEDGSEQDGEKRITLWQAYEDGFQQALLGIPGTFYAVANFNLRGLEPEWCYQRLNSFDMKVARRLHGKNWSRLPDSERTTWIAVPEQATYLHYNLILDVPIPHQERFFLEAPGIWREVVPSGQFDVHVIGEEPGEAAAVRKYCGKTFNPTWTIDNTITSSQLRRKK
jgi:hypothetical protein